MSKIGVEIFRVLNITILRNYNELFLDFSP